MGHDLHAHHSPAFPTQIVSLLKHCRVFPPKIPCLLSPPLNRYLASPSSRYTPPETSMHPYRPRRAYYYFCGAVSPTHGLVELQFRDWLSAQVRRMLQRTMGCFDLQICLLDRFQPDAFMQERTQACPAQRWQFHTPHAQPWRSWHVRPARMVRFPQQFRSLGDKSAKCIAK